MYNLIRFGTSLQCFKSKSINKSSLIQPLSDSFTGLSVGVPAQFIDLWILNSFRRLL